MWTKLKNLAFTGKIFLIFKHIPTYYGYKVEKYHYQKKKKKGSHSCVKDRSTYKKKARDGLMSTAHFWIHLSFGLWCKNMSNLKELLCSSAQ